MLIASLLLVSTASVATPVPADLQTPPSPPPVPPVASPITGPMPTELPDPEGEALVAEFGQHLSEWTKKKISLSRGGTTPSPEQLGPHPALEYKERFRALLEQDSGWAQVWWLDNLQHLVDANDKRVVAKTFDELFEKLLARNASRPYMMNALGAIKAHRAALDAAKIDGWLERLSKASTNEEVQARATSMRAGFRLAADPEGAGRDDALELHRYVVTTWPRTMTAKESAGILLPYVESEFQAKERAWVAACSALVDKGRPASEWPRQPIHEARDAFLPLAQAAYPPAARWVRNFYAGYASVETQGPCVALVQLASGLGPTVYPDGAADNASLRLSMFELALRAFGDDPCVDAIFDDLAKSAALTPVDELEKALASVIAPGSKGGTPRRRALAYDALVRSCLPTGEWRRYEQAVAYADRAAKECAGEPLLDRIRAAVAPVRELAPGKPAPDFSTHDSENKDFSLHDYQGRVVLLAFYDMFLGKGLDDVATWASFQRERGKRPFSIVGVNAGAMDPEGYLRRATALGITWRSGLLYRTSDPILDAWMVKRYPTLVVVDAKGVIRGRDLSWAETAKLVDDLLAETEKK